MIYNKKEEKDKNKEITDNQFNYQEMIGMKEIVKNNIINYELIKIRQNTPVLEIFKKK